MARLEADREDLLREAVALVRRLELSVEAHAILLGFRATGWLSLYFDADPMYQFDELGRLRRAFVDGLLYRTQGSCLAQLERQRTAAETLLVRRDLSEELLASFRQQVHGRILWLLERLVSGHFQIKGQVPCDDANLVTDFIQALRTVLTNDRFLAPPIKK